MVVAKEWCEDETVWCDDTLSNGTVEYREIEGSEKVFVDRVECGILRVEIDGHWGDHDCKARFDVCRDVHEDGKLCKSTLIWYALEKKALVILIACPTTSVD